MDVRLPNGQVITNVPDSITQQQLAQIAIANNLAREEDFAGIFDAPQAAEEDDTTFLGATGEFFKGIPRGVANSLVSTGEGLFQLADAGLNLVGLEDAIDQEDEDVVLGLAKQGRDAVNESFLGADEAYRDSFGTKFGEGLGSFLTFLGPGLLGKAAGLTGKGMAAARYGGAGTLAVGAGAGDQSQRIQFARDQGIDVSGDQEDLAIGLGGAIALTELAPVEKLLKGMDRDLPEGFKKKSIAMLKKALGTGSVEAVQEGVAGVLQDAVALGVYDPDQKVGESLWDDLTVGGAVGTTADLIVTYAAGRRKNSIDQGLLETEKEVRERLEAEEQKRREQSSQRKLDPQEEAVTAPVDEEPDVINVQPVTVPFTTPSQAGEKFPDRKRVPVGTPTLVEGEKFAGGNPYAATAIEISRRLGDSFPLSETFTVAATATGAEGPVRQRTAVFDSQGKQYGPEYADPREAIQLAGALNGQVLEQTLEQNNALVIDEAGLDLDEDQRQTMLTLGRRVLGTDTNSYHKSAIDYAAGTTAENGYADDLTAQQAIDEGIRPKDMTASQRINAARLKKGLPETNNFSLSEARRALDDNVGRLAEFESGASEVDTLRAFSQDGAPAVSVDRDGVSTGVITTRPTTAAEKEVARGQGKRAPGRVKFTNMRDAQDYAGFINQRKGGAFVSSAEMFGEMELSQEKFAELLAAKNIDMDYNSPEMRKLAQILTGRKLRRDQSINDLKNEELQFLYHKMRAFPRFNKPTKLPVFELKPYSPAELQLAVDHLRQQGADISRAALEYQGKTMKARAYDQVINKAREVVSRDQAAVEEASQPEQTPQILALPSPDQRRAAMAEAIAARVKKLGLSDDFITRLVDRVRTPDRDAQGNVDFIESADPRQAAARGAFNPVQRGLQVSFDSILAEAGPNATDAELLVRILGTLNHEVLHSLRVLDLITEQEMGTLEKAARAYAPDGAQGYEAGETFFQYAERVYSKLDPVSRMEEAVAELIKYGYQNNLIDDMGKAVKLGGKPRGIITKIVDFLKEMVGFSRGTGARSFNDFLQALESGEVGARERGEVRTPVMLDKLASQQGITREEVAGRLREGAPRAQEGEERKPEFKQTTPDEPELAFDASPAQEPVDTIDGVSDQEIPPSIETKEEMAGYLQQRSRERLARQIDPEKIEKAVEQNLEDIDKTPGPPVFSVKASPEAQYIGRNPEAAITPRPEDQYFDTPPLSESQQKAVDELTTGPEKSQPNNEILLEVLEGGPIDTFYKRFKARMRLRAIKLRKGGINRHAVFEAISQRVPELREMEADSGAIQALILADRSNALTASAFKDGNVYYRGGGYGVEDFVFEGKKYKGLLEIMSLIYNKDSKDLRKLAQAYAMVQRGEFLSEQGKVVPVTEENKQQILAAVEAVTERNGYNPVTKWHDVWTAYNNKTIDFLKDTGVLSEETADIWRKSSYVPFYRAAQEDDTGLSKATGGIFDDLTKMSYFKQYEGSERAVDIGLVESVAMNLSAAVNMGMKNVAQQRVARDLQKLGLARQVVASSKNTITFKVNGRPVHFQIDDGLLYESLQTVDDGATIQRIAYYGGLPATFLREMVTRTPDFILANMFRDTLSTYVTSGGDFTPIVDTVFGFAESMNRLERRGVVGGYDFSIGEQSMKEYFETEAKRRGQSPDGKTLNMFRRMWDGLGMITTKSDAATRNAVYNDVLARTGNDAEATYQAIEIINYARRGSHPAARLLGALIPFLNARFQGIDVFVRAISGDYTTQDNKTRAKIIQRFAARSLTAMSLTAIYYMLVSDDDQYKRQSDETKDNNIIIPTSGPVPILLPSPFEVGLLLKTIPEAIIARVMGDRTDREVRDTMIRGAVSTLEINPLGVQAIAPLAEAAFNHNFFTNRPIVPFYVDKDIVGGFQDNIGTTEFAKFIGQNLPGNFSPMKIDHVIRGYSGTLGGYAVAMMDAVLKSEAVRGDLAALPPSKSIFQFPLWRRFFGTETGSAQKQDAYEMINEVKSVVRTANMLNKQQRYAEYNRFIEAKAPLLSAQDLANEISNELKNMRNEIKAIQAASMLDKDEKRERIKVIEAQIERYLNYQNPRMRSVIDLPVVDRAY